MGRLRFESDDTVDEPSTNGHPSFLSIFEFRCPLNIETTFKRVLHDGRITTYPLG